MANLPETSTFDAGVYQLELTDPVQGGASGVDNKPLRNLANRTRYLYDQLTAMQAAASNYASLNSPQFTGSPLVPTAAVGDSSGRVANTAALMAALFGIVFVDLTNAGNVVLLPAQYGAATVVLTGALSANVNVIFPSTGGRWTVRNQTSGAFSVSCKQAANGGLQVTQGCARSIYGSAGGAMVPAEDDYVELTPTINNKVNRTGGDTFQVNDPPRADRTAAAVSGRWVGQRGPTFNDGVGQFNAQTVNLGLDAIGRINNFYYAGQQTANLPTGAQVGIGNTIGLGTEYLTFLTVALSGGDYVQGLSNTFLLNPGSFVLLTPLDTGHAWKVVAWFDNYAPDFRGPATGQTPARSATGRQLQTVDGALAVGRRVAGQTVLDGSGRTQLTADDLGRCVTLTGGVNTFTAPQMSTCRYGDVLLAHNFDGTTAKTIAAFAGNTFNSGTASASGNSLQLNPGWTLEAFHDGGSNWNVLHYGPVTAGNRLQLLNSTSNPNTSTVTFTWAAGLYQEVLLEFDNAGTGTSNPLNAYFALQDANGNWTGNLALTSNNGTSTGTRVAGNVRLLDASRSVGQGLAGAIINPGSPSANASGSQGASNVLALVHAGGATGLRLYTGNDPWAVGNFNFLAR